MDAGILTEDGNIAVMARSDDVINVAGHRLSTGALEEVVSKTTRHVLRHSLELHCCNYTSQHSPLSSLVTNADPVGRRG